MDLAIFANFLLFFGALGAGFAIDSLDTADVPAAEPHENGKAGGHYDTNASTDESIAADRDNLAWFLTGGDDDLMDTAQDARFYPCSLACAGAAGKVAPFEDEGDLAFGLDLQDDSADSDMLQAASAGIGSANATEPSAERCDVEVIPDFVRGTDQLTLEYHAIFDKSGAEVPPVITLGMGPQDAYIIVSVDGDPVAHLTGVTELRLCDITLMRTAA